MGNRTKELVKDTFIFAIGNIGSKLILFFLVPLYTNYMSKAEYGTADLIFTVSQLVLPFVSIVIYDALGRFGLSKDERPEDVLLSAVIVLGAGSIVSLILTKVFGLFGSIAPWRWQLTANLILSGFYSANMNYLKVKEKNIWYTVISLTYTALMSVLNILLIVKYHWGVHGYLSAYNISLAVAVFLTIVVGRIPSELRKAHFKKTLFIEMIQYSAPLILNNISWWVVHSSNKLLVKGNLGPDDLGLFTAASKIPAFVNVIINVFSQAWGISSTKEYESSNDSKFYASVLDVYSFICFGASIALISIIKPFMHLYVGVEFYEAWRIVPILLAAAAFASISYYYGSLYGVLKDSKRNMISTLIAAIVNLVVAWIGIKTIGVCGAAVGTLASYIVMSTIRKIDIGHHIPIEIDWRRFLLTCLLVLVQSVLVTVDFHGYVVSAITVLIFILLYKNMIIDLFAVIKGFLSGKNKDNGGETV